MTLVSLRLPPGPVMHREQWMFEQFFCRRAIFSIALQTSKQQIPHRGWKIVWDGWRVHCRRNLRNKQQMQGSVSNQESLIIIFQSRWHFVTVISTLNWTQIREFLNLITLKINARWLEISWAPQGGFCVAISIIEQPTLHTSQLRP